MWGPTLLYNYLVFALGYCCLQLLFCKISRAAGSARKIKIQARRRRCPGIQWLSSDTNTAGIRQTCWNAAGPRVKVKIPWFFHIHIPPNHKKRKFPIFNLKPQSSCSQKWDKLTNRNLNQELLQKDWPEKKKKVKRFQIEKCTKALLLRTRIIFAMFS